MSFEIVGKILLGAKSLLGIKDYKAANKEVFCHWCGHEDTGRCYVFKREMIPGSRDVVTAAPKYYPHPIWDKNSTNKTFDKKNPAPLCKDVRKGSKTCSYYTPCRANKFDLN